MRDIFKSIERNRKTLKKLQDIESDMRDINLVLEATLDLNKKLIAKCQQLRQIWKEGKRWQM